MGYVTVKARICNVERTNCKDLELVADTGAIYTAISEDILFDLGVKPKGRRKFKIASGEVKEFDIGEVYVEIGGDGVHTIVAFLPKGSKPLLGVTTLELLGLQVDPVTGELKPMELLLL